MSILSPSERAVANAAIRLGFLADSPHPTTVAVREVLMGREDVYLTRGQRAGRDGWHIERAPR